MERKKLPELEDGEISEMHVVAMTALGSGMSHVTCSSESAAALCDAALVARQELRRIGKRLVRHIDAAEALVKKLESEHVPATSHDHDEQMDRIVCECQLLKHIVLGDMFASIDGVRAKVGT